MEDYQNFNRNYNDVYNMIQEHQAEEEDGDYGHEEAKQASFFGMSGCSMPNSKKKAEKSLKKPESEAKKGGIFSNLGDKISAGLFKASKATQKSLVKK